MVQILNIDYQILLSDYKRTISIAKEAHNICPKGAEAIIKAVTISSEDCQ